MFIRKTTTRRVGNTAYELYRLVQSVREGERVRQTVLLNLGSDFAVPKPQWRELVAIITDQLTGSATLFERDPDLCQVADAIVRKLRRQGFDAPEIPPLGLTEEIVIDSLQCDDARSVGASVWRRYRR